MSILNHIKNAYNRAKTVLFHPKVNDTIKTVRNSVFLATLGAAGAVEASVSHNTQMSSVQQSGTSEFQAVKMYEVQSGDVLGKIALNHKISLNDLLKNNPNVDVNGLIFPGQKIVIPVDVDKIPTDDNSNFDNVVIVGKKDEEFNTEGERKSPETSEGPSEYNFEIALKNGLSTEKISMSIIFEYVKGFYPEVFASKDKKAIIDVFIKDYEIYSNNNVLNEVDSMQSILGEEKDIQVAQFLSQIGYDGLGIHDILKTMLVVETSGGLGKMYIAQALKTQSKEAQNEFIEKAVFNFVGNAGDSGYYHVIGSWIQTEIDVQKLEGVNYIPGRDRLRNQLRAVIQKGIEEKRSVDDIMKVMAKIDVRFNLNEMSRIVGNWFIRTKDSLEKHSNISLKQSLELTFIGYNRGTGAMNKRAEKLEQGGELKMTNDLRKRISVLNTIKLDNDLQIAHAESKQPKKDHLPPAFLYAVSDKVALALGKGSLNKSQAELIASKYSSQDALLTGLEQTLKSAQRDISGYNLEDVKKLQNLIANLKYMDVKDVANILGISPKNINEEQIEIIKKILKAPGNSPEEKLHHIILSTRNFYYHLAEKKRDKDYVELIEKLDGILSTLKSQGIVSTISQYAV